MQPRKSILVIVSLLLFTASISQAAEIKISGGEDHTLVLTENQFVWACGPEHYHYRLTDSGVLHIGDDFGK
jgi:alpha-tubulin suppressor-like RCC1 family protein